MGLCGARTLENACNLPSHQQSSGEGRPEFPNTNIALTIRNAFQTPGSAGRLVQDKALPDLAVLMPSCITLLNGMLNVSPQSRWKAQHVEEHQSEFPLRPG